MIPELYPQTLPKAVLFDWDNTLVDTWRVAYDALNLALKALGRRTLSQKDFWEQPHLSIRDSGLMLFGDLYEEGERIFYEAVEKLHLKELVALQGAESLLKDISARGLYTGVVSNKNGPLLRREVEHLGWKNHFHRVIGSRDAEQDKPSHLPVLAALQTSTVIPSHDVWFVGDSRVDLECARASGCIPVVIGGWDGMDEDDIIHVNDCNGLAQLIAKL